MEELVWRKAGEERCEKSYVKQEQKQQTNQQEQHPQTQNVITASPQGGVGCLPQGGFGGLPPLNKRESASAKINERYLVGQSIQNPFMPNSNYINDLEVQMNFLTPQKNPNDYGKN
jgi:hypothetical protein